jgi:hypothetical protein
MVHCRVRFKNHPYGERVRKKRVEELTTTNQVYHPRKTDDYGWKVSITVLIWRGCTASPA